MTISTPTPFCHIVIPAPDLGKAEHFYTNVFGWKVTPREPGPGYWFFHSGNVDGAFDAKGLPMKGSVVLVLRVAAMGATLDQITAHGGRILRGRSAIGEASKGYDAYFLDPNGNELGIYSED
jgi:Predicted enzyme related to lactoylglutathione lyase